MRCPKVLITALYMSVLAAVPTASLAGDFNCDVVYDEFESLMNKRFLEHPDDYVRTQPGRISRQQFEDVASADFLLYPGRQNLGIGILTTNQNIHAKFLFHWSQPMVDGTRHVILDEVVKYGRVADGYAARRIGPFRLKPGMAIDIDSGSYIPVEGGLLRDQERARKAEAGDLRHETALDGAFLSSINGAELAFPLATLCRGN